MGLQKTAQHMMGMALVLLLLVACGAPAESAKPTATSASLDSPLDSEESATTVQQVAGLWALRLAGGGEGDPAVFTLDEDGTFSFDAVGGYHKGMNVGVGTFSFDGDVLVLDSDQCDGPRGLFKCTATYHVYVAMAGNEPASLRFIALKDPHTDRKNSLNKKTLLPAEAP